MKKIIVLLVLFGISSLISKSEQIWSDDFEEFKPIFIQFQRELKDSKGSYDVIKKYGASTSDALDFSSLVKADYNYDKIYNLSSKNKYKYDNWELIHVLDDFALTFNGGGTSASCQFTKIKGEWIIYTIYVK